MVSLTPGCAGCTAISKKSKNPLQHSDGCTKRVQELMEKTPEGAERIEKRKNTELEVLNDHHERQVRARQESTPVVPEMPSDANAASNSSSSSNLDSRADQQNRPQGGTIDVEVEQKRTAVQEPDDSSNKMQNTFELHGEPVAESEPLSRDIHGPDVHAEDGGK